MLLNPLLQSFQKISFQPRMGSNERKERIKEEDTERMREEGKKGGIERGWERENKGGREGGSEGREGKKGRRE